MTDEQIERFIKDRMSECLSSFIIIGFRGDNHSPLVITQLPDAQSAIATNALVCGIVGGGGFEANAKEE